MDSSRTRLDPACRELLLRPKELLLLVNDVDNAFYLSECAPTCPVMDTFPGTDCVCSGKMSDKRYITVPPDWNGDRLAFLRKGLCDSVITDDLFITPSSATLKQKLYECAGVDEPQSGRKVENLRRMGEGAESMAG